MTFCAAVRALATLAAQCRDAVEFFRTPHAGADRLWAETTRRDGADSLAEQEAEEEVSEPCAEQQIADEISEIAAEFGDTFRSGLLRPIVGSSARLDAIEARLFALEKRAGLTPTRIDGYPPFNPSNHESSSVDGEAATVAGPPTEDSPVASVSADLDATGPPNKQQLAWAAEALRDWSKGIACDAPRFWREIANQIDPEK